MKTRRQLLQGASLAVAGAPMIVKASALGLGGAVAPSDRISLASIGLGWMGFDGHLSRISEVEETCALSPCATWTKGHLTRGKALVDTAYGDQGARPIMLSKRC